MQDGTISTGVQGACDACTCKNVASCIFPMCIAINKYLYTYTQLCVAGYVRSYIES